MSTKRHYILALDDTGNSAPLLTPDLEPGEVGKHTPVGLGAFILRKDYYDSFVNDWYDLRCRIQVDLGFSAPPPIHLRLMYGKRLRKKASAQVPNPYYVDTIAEAVERFPVIVKHLTAGADLIAKYTQKKRVATLYKQLNFRDKLIENMHDIYANGDPATDLIRLKAVNRKVFDAFFRELTRPLLPAITTSWLYLDELIADAGGTSGNVRFDKFAGTENLASETAHRIMQQVGQLERLHPNALCADSDEDAMIQAADLSIYLAQRGNGGDQTARQILNRDFKRLTTATYDVIGKRINRKGGFRSTVMHYAVARAAAEAKDPDFVNNFLKTPSEMTSAFEALGASGNYVSLFKDGV